MAGRDDANVLAAMTFLDRLDQRRRQALHLHILISNKRRVARDPAKVSPPVNRRIGSSKHERDGDLIRIVFLPNFVAQPGNLKTPILRLRNGRNIFPPPPAPLAQKNRVLTPAGRIRVVVNNGAENGVFHERLGCYSRRLFFSAISCFDNRDLVTLVGHIISLRLVREYSSRSLSGSLK